MALNRMNKSKARQLLDFIPLIMLLIAAIDLIWTLATTNLIIVWMNIVGLIILPINILIFLWRHKIGVIAMGVTFLLGFFELLSFFPGTRTFSFGFTANQYGNDLAIRAQPSYLLLLLLQILISHRYFFGIASKKYWDNLIREMKTREN
jgi:hypothetical protein